MVEQLLRRKRYNIVVRDDSRVIVTVFSSPKDFDILSDLEKIVLELRKSSKKITISLDITRLKPTQLGSNARIELSRILRLPYDRIAISTKSQWTNLLVGLIFVTTSTSNKARVFSRLDIAEIWLDSNQPASVEKTQDWFMLAAILTIIGLATTSLFGWWFNIQPFIRPFPSTPAINPITALAIITIGLGLISLIYVKNILAQKVFGWLALAWVIVFLTPAEWHKIFFLHSKLMLAAHPQVSVISVLTVAIDGLFLIHFNVKRAQQKIFRTTFFLTALILSVIAFVNAYSLLYAQGAAENFSPTYTMAFYTSIGFLTLNLIFLAVFFYRTIPILHRSIASIVWLILPALIFTQIATYGAWAQARRSNDNETNNAGLALTEHITNAVNSSFGYYNNFEQGIVALFAASDQVTQKDFAIYTAFSKQSQKSNPQSQNFIAAFVSAVSDKDLPAYINQRVHDTSLNAQGNPSFHIISKSTAPIHYIVTYSTDESIVKTGTDLSANPLVAAAITKVTEAPVVPAPASVGNFVNAKSFAIFPVQSETSQTKGFMYYPIDYNKFFAAALSGIDLHNDQTHISFDDQSGKTIATINDSLPRKTPRQSYHQSINLAGSGVTIHVATTKDFSLNATQRHLPTIILLGGQFFSLVMVWIFIVFSQSKRRAVNLADAITRDLQNERNLATESKQRQETILFGIQDAVIALDNDKKITLFNPSAESLSGISNSEALNSKFDEIIQLDGRKKINLSGFIDAALAGHSAKLRRHTILINKKGKRIPVAGSAVPQRNLDGDIVGAIVALRDTSVEEELDRQKTEFVSLASHQLRTPLSAIGWYSEMLLNGDAGKLTVNQTKFLKEISTSNSRMVDLVNMLLDVSRIESGKLAYKAQSISITKVLSSAEKELASAIKEKDLLYVHAIEPNIKPLFVDPKLLQMIIQNLISNAVKYTPEAGSVKLTLREAKSEDLAAAGLRRTSKKYILLSVADTGYGIPKEQQNKVFEKLFRANNTRVLDVQGTGLGLYIVKSVVETMGGHIWFTSIETLGTTFNVLLPYQ